LLVVTTGNTHNFAPRYGLLILLIKMYAVLAVDRLYATLLCGPPPYRRGRILRRTLFVRLSVRPVSGCTLFTVAPSYERTSKIEKKLLFTLMGQRHVCTFRHAQRAAYRTAISAAQILVRFWFKFACHCVTFWGII